MARIFVTGSSDGLGRAAARSLLSEGHEVVLHARSDERASTLADLASLGAGVVIGDLRSAIDVRRIADQVNTIGRMDAVIHNAGIYTAPNRGSTPEGRAVILAVNTLAPFMLTALIQRPDRLVYLSSGLHCEAKAPYATLTGPRAPGVRLAPMPKASCTLLPSLSSLLGGGRRCSATLSIPGGCAS